MEQEPINRIQGESQDEAVSEIEQDSKESHTPKSDFEKASEKLDRLIAISRKAEDSGERHTKFYHATTEENALSIMEDGFIKAGLWGAFFCKDPLDACKFLILRGHRKIIVIEVEMDESDVIESFDHSEYFFQCKAYVCFHDVELTGSENFTEYTFDI